MTAAGFFRKGHSRFFLVFLCSPNHDPEFGRKELLQAPEGRRTEGWTDRRRDGRTHLLEPRVLWGALARSRPGLGGGLLLAQRVDLQWACGLCCRLSWQGCEGGLRGRLRLRGPLGHRPRARGPLLAVWNVGLFPSWHLVSRRSVSCGLKEGSRHRHTSWEGVA